MVYFTNNQNAGIVLHIISAIRENKAYLSEIDGLIGDGDHGINMSKGFCMAGEQIRETNDFSSAMKVLGDTLLFDIGGSMGPIYGTFFQTCARVTKNEFKIDGTLFVSMLQKALQEVKEIGGARVGDKTLIDTMEPAVIAFKKEWELHAGFKEALTIAAVAAEEGKESTRDMVARIGRAARLGERSRGVLDAGATSCCIILCSLFTAVSMVLTEE